MVLIFTVPPWDGLVITPGLLTFIIPNLEYLAAYWVIFDIGQGIAKQNGLSSKIKFAYKAYGKFIKLIEETRDYALGGEVLVVIPDDWDSTTHVKLANAWLGSSESKIIYRKLEDLGYKVRLVLVVRRVIKSMLPEPVVDLEPYMLFIKAYGNSLIYAIDANINTSMVNANIKCRHHPGECISNINIVADALVSELNDPWIHLLGPPPKLILSKFFNADTTGHTSNAIKSADTTGHRLDIVHYNARHKGSGKMNDLLMWKRLRDYLTGV